MLLRLKSGDFIFGGSNPIQLSCEFVRWSILNLQHLMCAPIQREAVGCVWSMLSLRKEFCPYWGCCKFLRELQHDWKKFFLFWGAPIFWSVWQLTWWTKLILSFIRENWNGRKKSWGLRTYRLERSKADSLWFKSWLCRWPAVWSGVHFLGPRLHPPHLKKVIAGRMTWKVMKIALPSARHTMRTQFMLISYIIYYII